MTTQHWFYIEELMTDVFELCAQTRRSIVAEHALSEGHVRSELTETGSLFRRPLELSDGLAKGHDEDPMLGIVGFRSRVRDRLGWLKENLSVDLTSREVYHVLFPLVIHIDELVSSSVTSQDASWQPLQLQLFDIDDGGEQFYTALDVLLAKEDTLALIFECYYFCLKDGFRGLYVDSPRKIYEYMDRLVVRMPKVAGPEASSVEASEVEIRLLDFPQHYYIFAVVICVVVFLFYQTWGYLDSSGA